MNEPVFDPAKIFAYALERASIGTTAFKQEIVKVEMVSPATVDKYAALNDCSKRRNPIERAGNYFQLFFIYARPAAFMVQNYFRELELRLMNNPTSPVEKFQPRELIRELRTALRIVEDLEAAGSKPEAYRDVLSEVYGIASTHTERILSTAPVESEPRSVPPVNWKMGQAGLRSGRNS